MITGRARTRGPFLLYNTRPILPSVRIFSRARKPDFLILFHFPVFGGVVPFQRGWLKVGRVRTGASVNPALARENFLD